MNRSEDAKNLQAMLDAREGDIVPDEVIPHGNLPPLKYRDLPEPVPVWQMLGPSIILAGMALGSGEFIIWPKLTYLSGFVFFWACLLGVATQYFINMEITRWTLATGESAITGFCRLSRHWAWVFLFLNVVPWIIPAWSKGAAQLLTWLVWPNEGGQVEGPHATMLAVAGLFVCGAILTAGPGIYETIERVQMFLVTVILVLVVGLALWLVRPDAVAAMMRGMVSVGQLPSMESGEITPIVLLGALAFAGAGGTLNLGQSNYVKDKGYGMGRYIGRITSPITGQKEAVAEIGYHFRPTAENAARWRRWWRAAGWEHFFSFFVTCVVCLMLLTLISYSVFYSGETGQLREGAQQYAADIQFVWGEAEHIGGWGKTLFLLMGVAILLTTEFGVLDACSRISTDIVKVNWLRENQAWSESRLYFLFLWGTILLGAAFLMVGTERIQGSFILFKMTAAMNGAVMFFYSMALLYLNFWRLPATVRMSWWRVIIMTWAVGFFGFFSVWAGWTILRQAV